jgi:exodeoxyribonuclease VII small subunit
MTESGAPTTPAATDSAASANPEIERLSFEVALERLEGIVDRLEEGDLELEAALAAFEEGVALSRRCAEQLGDAERRIEMLMRDGERWSTRPFESEDAAPEESD